MHHDLMLFDLDGTLSNPLEGVARSINFALNAFGYTSRNESDLAQYIGPPLDETFREITGKTHESEIKGLVAKYRERYAEIGYSENELYPGVVDTLFALRKTQATMAVCTSKRVDLAEQILKLFKIRHYFVFVNGGEMGIQKWQQIETLLHQGAVTEKSVMIGDRAVDLIAAHRNNLFAGGVLWGYGSQVELTSQSPHYLFQSPVQWLNLLHNGPTIEV